MSDRKPESKRVSTFALAELSNEASFGRQLFRELGDQTDTIPS
jgi:hypothetical protein